MQSFQLFTLPDPGVDDLLLVFRLAISQALGRPPLKSLLITFDNNPGNLAEAFQDVVAEMKLQPGQIADLKDRIIIARIRELDRCNPLAHHLIEKHKPDLVFTA